MTQIFVDADAMPRDAMASIRELAKQYNAKLITVSSINHQIEGDEHVCVDAHPQATDMYIVSHVAKDTPTIVVTQDYGLAALVLGKAAYAISPTGMEFTNDNMDRLLFERALHAHERRATGRSRGPKARSQENKVKFSETLEDVIRRIASLS